ncbi:DUF3606 domain-containing protein [Mucilaginibacter sp. ZT4R22]|uniref:DUF3606 domain-containing protein n=1 Tax=Mucilaginibacter pankratovii TaxID=2772110 RepID=A0ABR7WQE1_9SPHI|nr:DUF3606 domain-containing protein [Mucilaginibacter pankratovii]MBD1364539.1 DUF3606 domain-containing protein [Mucilaginibacter pankratovii]
MDNKGRVKLMNKDEIDINKKDEVEYWTAKFNISKVQLKAAVNAAGTRTDNVEAYLKKKYLATKV